MANNDEQRSATTIFTTAAQSIAARLIANKTTAKFTKAEISTTNLFNQSVTELQVLTSLDNVQQIADINTVTVVNDSTVDVNIAIDQTKAPNDYQMNSVGLFAVDGDGKEVLYSVTVLKDPVYIHQDAIGSALGIDLETVVGQADNVDLSINPAGAVTNEALKITLKDYVQKSELDALLPADIAETGKDNAFMGANSFKQAPTDASGNPYITGKDAQSKVDAGVKMAASDAQAKATAAQAAAQKYADDADKSLVKTADTADWQKQAMFNAGSFNVGSATSDYRTYVESRFSKAGVYYLRLENSVDVDANGNKVGVMDTHLISEGGGWYYASGIAVDGRLLYRRWNSDSDTGWQVGASTDGQVKGLATTILADGTDLNMLQEEGVYSGESLHVVNGPAGAPDTWLMVRVRRLDKSNGVQELSDTNSNRSWHRSWNSGNKWSPWVQSAVDSMNTNLVYNSRYTNNASGWDFCGGKGYLSVLAVSSYNTSPGFGINISDQSADAVTKFGASKPTKLVNTDVDGTNNVYFVKARAKIYDDSVAGSKIIVAMAFLDDSGEQVGDLSEDYVEADQNDVWTMLCVENVKFPAGATQVQIQYYGSGSHVHGMITEPMIAIGRDVGQYVPDTIGMADVADYQHVKLTADDGSAEYAWQDATQDLKELIKNLPLGVHTFLAASNIKSAPALTSGGLFRGLMHMASNMQTGTGYMIDSMTADAWSITCASGTVTFEKLASDAGSKSYTDAQLEAAVKKVLGETVRDNGDDTVTINSKRITPANAANMVNRNPDTGVVSEPVDFTHGTANGHPIVPIETSTDKDTAQADSTTTPNVIYLY